MIKNNAQFEEITPEIAESMLASTNPNRHVRMTYVNRLAREMSEGRWRTNGEAIIVDERGMLLDGQHRLRAIMDSGLPQMMLVVRGVSHEAMPTIDCGIKRTAGDVLGMRGRMNSNVLAGMVKMLIAWEIGIQRWVSSHAEILSYLDEHPELEASAARAAKPPRGISAVLCATAHAIFARIDQEAADQFVDDMYSGASMDRHDPVLVLRNRFLAHRTNAMNAKETRWMSLGLMIKAWNVRRRGGKTTRSVPVPKESGAFPVPV